MATLGLKRQGKLWAVMQGSEMVSSAAGGGIRAQSAADGREPQDYAEPDILEPHYDNSIEYRNVRDAFDDARSQPPLDDPERESERRGLERTIAEQLKRLGGPSRLPMWSEAEEIQLDEAMRRINDLLKLVGLSVTTYGHLG